jgi:DNA polymerase III delta subunit
MKIIVLHGEDSAKSYARLTKFLDSAKSRNWELIIDSFPNTPSLFGSDRLIVYRDYKLLTKNDIKNFDRFEGTLIIYHDGDLPAPFIKSMPQDFKMEKYDLPKLLFIFIDSVYPGNAQKSVTLLHQVIKNQPVELVMFFLAKHFRDLYWVLVDSAGTGFPYWKANKLRGLAARFTVSELKHLIGLLADIDIKVKTSKADLLTELDLLIVKELK